MNLRKHFAAYLAVSLIGCLSDETTDSPTSNTPTLGQATTAAPQANVPNAALPGKAIYDKSCAMCHGAPADTRTPNFATLTSFPATTIRAAISEGGKMAAMAASLSDTEKTQLIDYLTSGQPKTDEDWTKKIMCPADKRTVDLNGTPASIGFSVDREQTRSLTAQQAGLSKSDLKNLEVAWTLGFPGQGSGTGTGAAIVGNTAFVTGGGAVLALDTVTGCAKWVNKVTSKNTPTFGEVNGRKVLAFSVGSDIMMVDAKTGQTIWQANGQATGNAGSIRGGVVIYKDKVIVPISASGVVAGGTATFECCVGHGAVVALSTKDGSKLWEYHTMPNPTYTGKVSSTGVKQRGPSGAPIWSIPVIDAKRNRVIVATGENTSFPATDTSDAVIALDLNTGKQVWKFQAMVNDIWNMACTSDKTTSGPNCPWNIEGDLGIGRDFDFGASPLFAKANGKDIVIAGQKSGDVWAFDPENGTKLWNVRFGQGTSLGGIHWGITTDGERVFAAVNDPILYNVSAGIKPGVFSVDIKTGKPSWGYDAKPNCDGDRGTRVANCTTKYGFSAAPVTIDGAVVAGTLGGELMILDGKTGELLNKLDTTGTQKAINDVPTNGGSIESHGISAGAGVILVNSGYSLFNETPGNALIAYRAKKK